MSRGCEVMELYFWKPHHFQAKAFDICYLSSRAILYIHIASAFTYEIYGQYVSHLPPDTFSFSLRSLSLSLSLSLNLHHL